MKLILLACVLVLSSYAGAKAHSKSEETTPVNMSSVTEVDQIEIRFDDPMRVTAIALTGPDGEAEIERQTGLEPTTEFIATPKGPLAPGNYQVEWRGLSSDGHPMEGAFSFEVVD